MTANALGLQMLHRAKAKNESSVGVCWPGLVDFPLSGCGGPYGEICFNIDVLVSKICPQTFPQSVKK